MRKIFLLFPILFANCLFGQTADIIAKANQLGSDWKFEEAINLLENRIKTDQENAELYYWIGRYSHYLVYDTRPFDKKSDNWSKDRVLTKLKKAVELKPDFGDAKYFLATEFEARALEAL